MKKIISIIVISLLLISFHTENTSAESSGYFRVTAYYSPLPNQKYYIKGDYWAELRMNGNGIRGASGKKVFSGMLAAPSSYKFGTKIYLEGLGVGEVSDRGGAIVHAGERKFKYDRIDVWVGYGDEGLRRAMYWGNRVIKGNILKNDSKITIDYKKIPAPSWAVPKKINIRKYITKIIKSDFEIKLEQKLKIFNKKIENPNETKILQERLINLELYNGEINGNYKSIRDIISKYQLNKQLIRYIGDIGTGYFGPKTRASLKKDYKDYLLKKEEERKKIEEFEEQINLFKIKAVKQAQKTIKNIGNVRYKEVSHGVRELQKTLNKLGYFNHKDTAIFGNKTKQALIKYQLDKKIIANKYIPGTGYFGPNTKKQMLNDLAKINLMLEITNNNELAEYYMNKQSNLTENIQKNKEI